MPIKSYLAHVKKGRKNAVLERLSELKECESIPSQNKDIIVLITDTQTIEAEKELEKELEALEDISHLSLVAGFADEINKPQV